MKKPKVIIIGLDGATWNILTPLIEEGSLPFLQSIYKKSTAGNLISTTPPITGPAWSSFQTGVNPGKHGVFDFFEVRNNPKSPDLIGSQSIRAEKLWQFLGKSAKKSLLVNMPISYPLEPMRGVIISSFLTPVGAKYVEPESLRSKLDDMGYQIDILATKKYGEVPGHDLTEKEKQRMVSESIKIAKNRVKAFQYLANLDEYDCYFIFFKETDFLQHLFYAGKETRMYLKALDSLLKVFIDFCNKTIEGEKYYIMLSDHGFHETAHEQFSPFVWLKQLMNDSVISTRRWSIAWDLIHKTYPYFKKLGIQPRKLKAVEDLRTNLVTKAREDDIATFVEKGYLPSMRGVYLFEKIRTKQNIDKIISAAKTLKHKGKFVFKLVKKSTDVYHGPFVGLAPDIVWIPNQWITINQSPLSDELFSPRPTHLQGDHYAASQGIVMLWGEKIKTEKNITAHIEDILPTTLHILEVPIPNEIDGKVLQKYLVKKKMVKSVSHRQRIEMLIDDQLKTLE